MWAARAGMTARELLFAVFLVFAFASGVQAHLMPSVFPITQVTTDFLLLGICVPLLLFVFARQRDARLWTWVGVTYVGTFLIEAAGVATGRIFGAYAYGPTMWIQWLDVPLVIALNWAMLILATNQIAAHLLRQPWAVALAAAVLIAGYDYFIEPVAIRLDYWTWAAVEVPTQNYVAWAVVAFVFSWPLQYFRIRYESPLLLVYAVAQLAFFVALDALLG